MEQHASNGNASRRRKREGIQEIFKIIIAENFSKLMTNTKL